jgi:Lrp/AsnC family leucine-responsive transcriptional regulator
MPFQLDDYDVSILRSLLEDGRKSFREVSRETGITTPTVKARFARLVNVGFIKSVSPILDFSIVENENIFKPKPDKRQGPRHVKNSKIMESNHSHGNNNKRHPGQLQQDIRSKIKRRLKIKLNCEFCKGPITGVPNVYRFADYERFFCCTTCMSDYKRKYAGRINSITRKFEEERNFL